MEFQPDNYGPVFAPLVAIDRRRPLDAGHGDPSQRAKVRGISIEQALAHARLADRNMALCCLSAVWLLHDFLDESHELSQQVETPSGSFWHGIMHRREGDFSNAKYWFRRVGPHRVFEPLAAAAEAVAGRVGGSIAAVPRPVDEAGRWDPHAMVDLCQRARQGGDGPTRELALELQQAEWELLFDDCYRAAIGG